MAATSTDNSVDVHGEFAVRVYYEDTDFTGYVYHANYLRFCERAREHLLGIENLRNLYDAGRHFVVKRMNIEFLNPAHHGDELTVASRLKISSSPRWMISQEIWRPSSSEKTKIFSAEIELVHVNREGKPTRVDQEFIQLFA